MSKLFFYYYFSHSVPCKKLQEILEIFGSDIKFLQIQVIIHLVLNLWIILVKILKLNI
jgi:hypothetical protein